MSGINVKDLKENLGSGARLITDEEERKLYRRDLGELPSWFEGTLFNIMPDIVLQPASTKDVSEAVKFAAANGLPLIARGCSSWGFGGSIPVKGGIVVDFSPLSSVLEVDEEEMIVRVQAGARWSDIDDHLTQFDLTLKTYSSSKFTTVAGWLSTGGIGINSFGFGPAREHVAELTVVTGSGQIRTFTPKDDEFKYFFETEGQIGIITEVVLRVRKRPAGSFPYLFQFKSLNEVFAFIERVSSMDSIRPTHIGYIDSDYIAQINLIRGERVVEEKPSVIIHFDSELDGAVSTSLTSLAEGAVLASEFKARYLWHERLFTMMIKRLGPKILAGESYMHIDRSAAFIERVKGFGKSFGTEISFEGHMSGSGEIVLMCFFLSGERERLRYLFHMALSGMIGKLGLKMGGKPYGLGIWNSAFALEKYGPDGLKGYRRFKKETDPTSTLNSAKWLDQDSRGLILSKIMFSRAFFSTGMDLLIAAYPLVGFLAKASRVKRASDLASMTEMEKAALICSHCGSCMKVCPAYLITKDEAVTSRAKLELARRLMTGEAANAAQAKKAFLCMHCRACEKICQNELHLVEVWEELEGRLKEIYGWPKEALEGFVRSVESNEEYGRILDQSPIRRSP